MTKKLSKITIIGLGLIGGSIAKALKKANFKGEIVGVDADLTAVAYGLQNNLITCGGTEVNNQIKGSDLVVLATHLRFFEESIEALLKIDPEILVTDVGSVKSCDVIQQFVEENGLHFIGGHPLAGSEKTGIRNADPSLFVNKPYYVLPYDNTEEDTTLVLELVELIGANACVMEEIEHDKLVSFTSHIPHLLAALQVNLLAKCSHHNVMGHLGAGFKDATRIAGSSPDLWADIIMFNRKEILLQIEHIQEEMAHLSKVIADKDRASVYDFFDQASKVRNQLS